MGRVDPGRRYRSGSGRTNRFAGIPTIAWLFVHALAPFGYVPGLDVPSGTLLVASWVGPASNAAAVFLLALMACGVVSARVSIGAFTTLTSGTTEENRGRWFGYVLGRQSLGSLVPVPMVYVRQGSEATYAACAGGLVLAMLVSALPLVGGPW